MATGCSSRDTSACAPGTIAESHLPVESLPEPGHRAVEMLELAGALDQMALTPLERAPVRGGGHDPVQDRQEDRPLDTEAEPPALEEVADHGPKARLPPEALEDGHGADAPDDRLGIPSAVRRREDHEVLAEAGR